MLLWHHHAAKIAAAKKAAAAKAAGVAVIGEPATRGDVGVYLSGLGAVTPLATVTVHTRVDGELQRVDFVEGQMVEKGQLLVQIDPRPFEAQLALAKGQLRHDLALLENEKIDLTRYATLIKQDSIPKQQYDTQRSLVQQQEGTVDADRGNVQTAELQIIYSRITAPRRRPGGGFGSSIRAISFTRPTRPASSC